MKNILLPLMALLVVSSCSTTKLDYNTAYKFSNYQYQSKSGPEYHHFTYEPIASIKPSYTSTEIIPPFNIVDAQNQEQALAELKTKYSNASKKEKKELRRQIKQDYKSLKKEVKEARKDATNQDIVFNKKMYIGAVVLGAGILVAILASGAVGAVGIIVGIGLIAWGFIEQA